MGGPFTRVVCLLPAGLARKPPLGVWDTVYFARVARCGYETDKINAFFPGLPAAMRAGGAALGGEALSGPLLAGVCVLGGFGAGSCQGGSMPIPRLIQNLTFALCQRLPRAIALFMQAWWRCWAGRRWPQRQPTHALGWH